MKWKRKPFYALFAFSCSSGILTHFYIVNITACPPGTMPPRFYFSALLSWSMLLKETGKLYSWQHSKLYIKTIYHPNYPPPCAFLEKKQTCILFLYAFFFSVHAPIITAKCHFKTKATCLTRYLQVLRGCLCVCTRARILVRHTLRTHQAVLFGGGGGGGGWGLQSFGVPFPYHIRIQSVICACSFWTIWHLLSQVLLFVPRTQSVCFVDVFHKSYSGLIFFFSFPNHVLSALCQPCVRVCARASCSLSNFCVAQPLTSQLFKIVDISPCFLSHRIHIDLVCGGIS